MVRCWNCEHLIRMYSGNPRKEELFENEYRKCKIKGAVYEHYDDYTKERECEDYRESKHKVKYEQVAELRRKTFHIG